MAEFSAQVSKFVRDSERALNAVYRTAIDDTIDDMLTTKNQGGNLPIDTGNLRRSFLLSTSGLPSMSDDDNFSGENHSLVLAGVTYDDIVYGGFQAVYARRQNFGGGGVRGNYFVDLAVAKWVENVANAERRNKVR